ncbi:MAG: hypothetical protein ACREKL_05020, partial [Chthoniobacterales bacterium]
MKENFSAEITAINLQRIWWIVITSTALNVAILAFNLLSPALGNAVFAEWQLADAALSAALLVIVRRLQNRAAPPAWKRAFVAVFLVLVMAFMDNYYFVLLRPYGHTAAYVLGVITLGVLLLLPPRIFIAILLANHAVYCALLFAGHPASGALAAGILDG